MFSQRFEPKAWNTLLTRLALPIGVLALCTLGAACTSTNITEKKIDYKSQAVQGNPLEIPPDLTQIARNTYYTVPDAAGGVSVAPLAKPSGPVIAPNAITAKGAPEAVRPGMAENAQNETASASKTSLASSTAQSTTHSAASAVGTLSDKARIERAGAQRWLWVNLPITQVWPIVHSFWPENGFATLTVDEPKLGIVETDWAEDRAKLPKDFIRSALGGLLDSLYSTGERDKFRTRLEQSPHGGTEIYISHIRAEEVYTNASKTQTEWRIRPAAPELEAEFLRRLMLKLGLSQEESAQVLSASASNPSLAHLETVPDHPSPSALSTSSTLPHVLLQDGFNLAWSRLGQALDSAGYAVQDRNHAQGIYKVSLPKEGKALEIQNPKDSQKDNADTPRPSAKTINTNTASNKAQVKASLEPIAFQVQLHPTAQKGVQRVEVLNPNGQAIAAGSPAAAKAKALLENLARELR